MSKESKTYKNLPKKVYIRTFGCQMNTRDSEVIIGLLKKEGFRITDTSEDADAVILNTCSVRQHAEDKVWSEIGRVSKRSTLYASVFGGKRYPKPIIGLVGCMAQNYKQNAFERAPQIDFVVGPSDIDKIPGIIKKLSAKRYLCLAHGFAARRAGSPHGEAVGRQALNAIKIWETDGDIRRDEIYHIGFYEDKNHAFVVISEGCSNYCSYCIVPFVRGELHHRNYEDILKEIKGAVDKGINSITLLGQNVCAYGRETSNPFGSAQGRHRSVTRENINFIKLLELVNKIEGLKEFDFVTSHPKDTSADLFKTMAECEKLRKFLHLPVQSGSDRILKLMNRGYTRNFYLDLTANYRKIVKGGALTTDTIVGFPTETEADFQDTYNLVKEVRFNSAFIFKYSPRPHTPAEKLIDDVPKEAKEKRHSMVLELQKKLSREKMLKEYNDKCQNLNDKINSKFSRRSRDPDKSGQCQIPKPRFCHLLFVICAFFGFCALSFVIDNAYALDLYKLKVNFLNGDYKQVINEGEKIMAKMQAADESDELYYLLGLSYLKDGNYLRASDIFEIILDEFKHSRFKEETRLALADTYFLRGDFVSAKKHYQNLLENNPQTKLKAAVYYRLSKIGFKLSDTQLAKDYLDKLNSEFPLNPEAKGTNEVCRINDAAPALYYSIQVGSFSRTVNAANLKDRLVKDNYPAYVEEVNFHNPEKKIFRVRVGKFQQRQEAVDMEERLTQEGYPTKICP